MMLDLLLKDIERLKDPKQAKILQRFFKTGKGEYGEGDIFLGIKVPIQRKLVKQYKNLSITEVKTLLKSSIHEHRLIALLILVEIFNKGDKKKRKEICELYLKNTGYINNWDLVDLSAHHILGNYLIDKKRDILSKLAISKILWERRISIISTLTFIRNNDYKDTIQISDILINDEHDLIHKAVGWMLREVGKKDLAVLEDFLKKNHKIMPRTMLRYSIERLDENKRRFYMRKNV